jgi:hypothetical protein
MSNSLNGILNGAKKDGLVTAAGIQAFNIVDLGDEISDNLGISPDLVDALEVFAFFGVVDDSGSIRFSGNTDVVKAGYNGILEALTKSNSRDDIIVGATLLNGGSLHPTCALKDAKRLDSHFNPGGGTPLYDRVIQTCELVVLKCKEFQDTGASFKGVIVIVTDGNDQGSRAGVQHVKAALEPLLAKEIVSVVALGISDGSTDFRKVFQSMGIPDNLILTVNDDPSSIRKAFGVVSRATAAASQGASLSQTGLGGFGV